MRVWALLSCFALAAAPAESSASGTAGEVRLSGPDGSGLTVGSQRLTPDVDMTGVAVINGEVFIDGDKVPPGRTSYKGRKSGKTYRIQWGKDGNVSVAEK